MESQVEALERQVGEMRTASAQTDKLIAAYKDVASAAKE
jgi:hypothetical protein